MSLAFLASSAIVGTGIAFPKSIDVETLAAIVLALLLAWSGFQQRRQKINPPVVVCPNKVEELWPTLDDLVERISNDTESIEGIPGAVKAIHELKALHEVRDSDGVPRWYSRDQGKVTIAILRDCLDKLSDLEREVEIMNRTRRSGNNGGGSRR